ncbi:hypothetical protein GCM10010872_08510 [Dyella flava]|nr:hypothetical protein GCM10010872_08510 [Dyella flava]
MMRSPITRSDRPLTNGERLAAWCEAAHRHAMRVDSSVYKVSPRRSPCLFLKAGAGNSCETEAKHDGGRK